VNEMARRKASECTCDTSYASTDAIEADPSLKWRRINKANLQVVGAAQRAGDYP
jgi:hypothetical protein